MKTLQKQILKKIYSFETKRTILELIVRISSIFLIVGAGTMVFIHILQKLAEQQTLDLLQLFQEDIETIRMYIGEIMYTLFEELPKFETVSVLILLIISVTLILISIKNFGKIKNKILALKKYWLKH